MKCLGPCSAPDESPPGMDARWHSEPKPAGAFRPHNHQSKIANLKSPMAEPPPDFGVEADPPSLNCHPSITAQPADNTSVRHCGPYSLSKHFVYRLRKAGTEPADRVRPPGRHSARSYGARRTRSREISPPASPARGNRHSSVVNRKWRNWKLAALPRVASADYWSNRGTNGPDNCRGNSRSNYLPDRRSSHRSDCHTGNRSSNPSNGFADNRPNCGLGYP